MKDDPCTPDWTIEQRLDHHSMPEPNSGCLLWIAGVNNKGYGVLSIGPKALKAHRVAWAHRHGPIPSGLQVCHKCDVPSCININHLFLGTNQDNALDMIAKGRKPVQSLVPEDAIAIYHSTESSASLSEKYGVDRSLITRIKAKRSWKRIHQEKAQ